MGGFLRLLTHLGFCDKIVTNGANHQKQQFRAARDRQRAECFMRPMPDCFGNHKEETKLVSKTTVLHISMKDKNPERPKYL